MNSLQNVFERFPFLWFPLLEPGNLYQMKKVLQLFCTTVQKVWMLMISLIMKPVTSTVPMSKIRGVKTSPTNLLENQRTKVEFVFVFVTKPIFSS